MGKNPWEDADPDIQALATSMRPRRSFPWGRVFGGLAVVVVGTFVFGYYLPLVRAHEALTKNFVALGEKAHALDDSMQNLGSDIERVTKARDELLAERDDREEAEKSEQKAARELQSKMEAALGGYVDKGLAAVATEGEEVIVALSNRLVFVTGQTKLSRQGQGALCDAVKKDTQRPITVEGVWDDKQPIPALLARQYTDTWSMSAALAASAASELEDTCSVSAARLSARGLGDAKDRASVLHGVKPPGIALRFKPVQAKKPD
jgi:flagellar motor protein MotB